MSRIGKAPVAIPSGVTVTVDGASFKVQGPKGELHQEYDPIIGVEVKDAEVLFSRSSDLPDHRAKHGLYRSLCAGMVEGVTNGYKKELELVGVGFRASGIGSAIDPWRWDTATPSSSRCPRKSSSTAESTEGFQPQGHRSSPTTSSCWER